MGNEAEMRVWVSAEEKVASFHGEEGYERKDYSSRDSFLDFLQSLAKEGYRFM